MSKKKTKWVKNCPNCNDEIYFTNQYNRNKSIKNGKVCRSCSNRQRIITEETCRKISESNKGKKRSLEFRKKVSLRMQNISDETRKKMSDSAKGKQMSLETRKKISKSNSGENHPNYGTNGYWFGKKRSTETRRKIRLATAERIKRNSGQISPNYNPSSIPIIEAKARELGITDLQHAENGGEFYIKELGYWVDGYSKKTNTVIEYYEKYHSKPSVKKRDLERQDAIVNHLKCKFIIILSNEY